jgi:repressor of nif and glnA expression
MAVPPGMAAISTVCSVTLNGIFFSQGIPTASKFGGLLELKNRQPTRFVEIIHYNGTTIDPLEIFIRSGMTDYIGAIDTGNGRVGAGFREIPAETRSLALELSRQLERAGLGGVLTIGWPGQPLLEIPVNEGRIPLVVMGGLNPTAILEESGIKVRSRALSGLADYRTLFPYEELDERIRRMSHTAP